MADPIMSLDNLYLREGMDKLETRVEEFLRDYNPKNTGADIHWQICKKIADRYDLWDDQARFPLWLSRVVAGIMSDQGFTDGN